MMKKNYNYPVIIFTYGLMASTMLTLSFYTKRIRKIYYDPHIWIPWQNKNPWKNKISNWWYNKTPWINTKPWKNKNPWINKNPWQNKLLK